MIVTKPTLSALQHLKKWATTRDLADASKLSIQAARKRIFRLIEAGLVESREAHDNPKGLNEFRITTEGAKSLETITEQAPHKVEPPVQKPTGSNPFDWRNYQQPVPSDRPLQDTRHTADTSASRFHYYSL